MFHCRIRRAGSLVLGLLCLIGASTSARADVVDDFIKTQNQVQALLKEQKPQQALPLAQNLLAQAERHFQNQPLVIAGCHHDLATVYHDLGKYVDAEQACRRELQIIEQEKGAQSEDASRCLGYLGHLLGHQDRFAEAEPLCKRSLSILERILRPDDPKLLGSIDNLSTLNKDLGHLREAEALARRALAIREKQLGPDHADVGWSWNNVGGVLHDQGRFVEAEQVTQRALAIFEKDSGPQSKDVANTLTYLGDLNRHQGRYAKAETLCKQSLTILERIYRPDDLHLVAVLIDLGNLYGSTRRFEEAEKFHRRALSIDQKHLGENHTATANDKVNVAKVCEELGRFDEAKKLYGEAQRIYENVTGARLSRIGELKGGLANVYKRERRFPEAERMFREAMAINEQALGPNHPNLAADLHNIASVCVQQQQFNKAEEHIDRAIEISERAGVAPGDLYASYLLRARLGWKQDRRGEALTDLRQAMQLAEQQRAQLAGGEHERAEAFAGFGEVFEQMVAWQVELQDAGEALLAIEKSHARSLLDELSASGADLDAGRSSVEREQLQRRENELKQQVIGLEHELKNAKENMRSRIESELAETRRQLYEHVRDARASSPVYRNLISSGGGPLRLSQVQRQLAAEQGLVLVYFVGNDGGYVLTIGPKQSKLTALTIDDQAAAALRVEPGPLNSRRLEQIVLAEKTGLAAMLSDPKIAQKATAQLAALWRVLIPEAHREQLTTGEVKRLVVIPDGPLALVPFETLVVVESGEQSRYLLDLGPPIVYAPSTTVLYNLAQRRSADGATVAIEPVLAVGDPSYPQRINQLASSGVLTQLTARSQFSSHGGDLTPLPFSGQEARWVREVFQQQGLGTLMLIKGQATEAQVRAALPGRKIIHLACHGRADQRFGNFFGSLALTPGSDVKNPSDDGFLELAEIYRLNLKSCELAILSACQTNFGPQQQGEGTWALSRGFLVAGARRIVASNWLVDDEAAASLVSIFCGGVAKAEKAGTTVDYAQSLQAAKRWVRQHDKWRSPYYWGTFVLVGPN